MKKTVLILSAFATIGAVTFSACKKSSSDSSTTPAPTSNLYTQVGGSTMVDDPTSTTTPKAKIEKGRLTLRSVVDSAILIIAGDPKLSTSFFPTLVAEYENGYTTGFSALSKNFTDFLCVATGSSSFTYGGKSMKDAHNPAVNARMNMKSLSTDFDNLVGDIGKSLNKNGVASTTQLYADLVTLLNTTKGDVVQGTPATMSLYTRVGGTTLMDDPTSTTTPKAKIETGRFTLRCVVDSAIYIIGADPKMTPFFGVLLGELGSGNTSGFAALSKNLTDFLSVATGSTTTTYGGKSMKVAHNPATNNRMGTKAAAADFDNFIGDVGKSLGKNHVTDQTLINDLVALLNTTKPDVIQK